MAQANLDPTDVQLLILLQRSGRMSNAELAERVGLSPSACLRRLNRLESEEIIETYRAVVSARKVGLGVSAFTSISLNSNDAESLDGFISRILTYEEVVACYATTGDSDFFLHVVTPDLEAYSQFVMRKLLVLPTVRTANSSIVLDTAKSAAPLPLGHLESLD